MRPTPRFSAGRRSAWPPSRGSACPPTRPSLMRMIDFIVVPPSRSLLRDSLLYGGGGGEVAGKRRSAGQEGGATVAEGDGAGVGLATGFGVVASLISASIWLLIF